MIFIKLFITLFLFVFQENKTEKINLKVSNIKDIPKEFENGGICLYFKTNQKEICFIESDETSRLFIIINNKLQICKFINGNQEGLPSKTTYENSYYFITINIIKTDTTYYENNYFYGNIKIEEKINKNMLTLKIKGICPL